MAAMLPPEVLDRIMRFLAPIERNYTAKQFREDNGRTLSQASLVCSTWQPVAQRRLLYFLKLASRHDADRWIARLSSRPESSAPLQFKILAVHLYDRLLGPTHWLTPSMLSAFTPYFGSLQELHIDTQNMKDDVVLADFLCTVSTISSLTLRHTYGHLPKDIYAPHRRPQYGFDFWKFKPSSLKASRASPQLLQTSFPLDSVDVEKDIGLHPKASNGFSEISDADVSTIFDRSLPALHNLQWLALIRLRCKEKAVTADCPFHLTGLFLDRISTDTERLTWLLSHVDKLRNFTLVWTIKIDTDTLVKHILPASTNLSALCIATSGGPSGTSWDATQTLPGLGGICNALLPRLTNLRKLRVQDLTLDFQHLQHLGNLRELYIAVRRLQDYERLMPRKLYPKLECIGVRPLTGPNDVALKSEYLAAADARGLSAMEFNSAIEEWAIQDFRLDLPDPFNT